MNGAYTQLKECKQNFILVKLSVQICHSKFTEKTSTCELCPLPLRTVTNINSNARCGYLGSTLLARRAVVRPNIELEICIKHKYHTNVCT